MKKKAQGLSLNVVIIAAIAIVVLIVMVLIFTGQAKKFTGGLADCGSKGGELQSSSTKAGAACYKVDDNQYCCISYEETPTPT